jgi:hypothetical protein
MIDTATPRIVRGFMGTLYRSLRCRCYAG